MSQHDHESHTCVEVEALGAVLERPADDPLRREVEACPRCAARLTAYREFIAEGAVVGARVDEARARLDAFRATRIEAPAMRRTDGARHGVGRWWRRLGESRALRPALVAATAVVVAAALWWHPWAPPAPVLRGVSDTAFAIASVQVDDGALDLSWSAFPEADAYALRVFTSDLTEVARFGPVAETRLSVPVSAIIGPAGGERSLLCSVVAISDGDEIAATPPQPLALP